MARYLLTIVVAALLCGGATPVFGEDLNAVLAKAMEGSKVPAMGVLIIRDDKVAGEAVRGVRRNDETTPATTHDVWHLGSDGKAMTATLIARLVDRGVLSWTTPLETLLPDLAATMRPEYRSVTLVQLLSHHSGLPENVVDEKFVQAFFAASGRSNLPARRLAYVSHALQDAPIGPTTNFSYSNTGFIIAAVIAERATGAPYEKLMRNEVFGPLGMTRVGFGLPGPGQTTGHMAGKPARPADENPDFFAPAGNMYMPLDDWARFCIDQLEGAQGHGKLLKAQTYQLMQTAQPGGTGGLGWGVQTKVAGRQGPVLTHAGSDGAWYALVALFPKTGGGVLVTANAGEDMQGDKADKVAFKLVVDSLSPAAP